MVIFTVGGQLASDDRNQKRFHPTQIHWYNFYDLWFYASDDVWRTVFWLQTIIIPYEVEIGPSNLIYFSFWIWGKLKIAMREKNSGEEKREMSERERRKQQKFIQRFYHLFWLRDFLPLTMLEGKLRNEQRLIILHFPARFFPPRFCFSSPTLKFQVLSLRMKSFFLMLFKKVRNVMSWKIRAQKRIENSNLYCCISLHDKHMVAEGKDMRWKLFWKFSFCKLLWTAFLRGWVAVKCDLSPRSVLSFLFNKQRQKSI